MVVGFAHDGRADRVIGIDASAKPQQTFDQILRISKNTAELVGLGRLLAAQRLQPSGRRLGAREIEARGIEHARERHPAERRLDHVRPRVQ
jgi:hypothetical protein